MSRSETWLRDRRLLMPFIVVATIVKLFAFGLLVRQNPHAALMHDTPSYTAPIEDLLHHASFTVRGVPEVQRTPGYPLLLALVTALFGNVLWSISLVALFGAATAVLTWELYRRLTKDRVPTLPRRRPRSWDCWRRASRWKNSTSWRIHWLPWSSGRRVLSVPIFGIQETLVAGRRDHDSGVCGVCEAHRSLPRNTPDCHCDSKCLLGRLEPQRCHDVGCREPLRSPHRGVDCP